MAYEFRALKEAIRFYHLVRALRLPSRRLKDQLVRAAESIALQLSEGDRRSSQQDRLCWRGINVRWPLDFTRVILT